MSITELSIKRPSLILVIFLVLTIGGIFSYTQLSYELIPKFAAPFVITSTIYPGAGPSEVENAVTKPLEDALSAMEGVVQMRSTSRENFSLVTIELKQGADVDKALQDAQRRINATLSVLPKDAKAPVLSKFSPDERPIMNIGAVSNLKSDEFFKFMQDRVKPAFSHVEGVGDVKIFGGQEREIQVNVNRQKLEAYNLTILQIVQAVRTANLDFPTGKVKNDDSQILIRLAGKIKNIEELRELVVFTNPMTGTPVKLREVAEVLDTQSEVRDLARVNSEPSLGIFITKQTDANAVAVSAGVKAAIADLEKQFQDKNLKFTIAVNSTEFTTQAVEAVSHDILLAIMLVAVVMLFFLHSIRNALIVMLSIPTSLVATLILMYYMNFTLNLMTLLAMSLVIGILVDDSIVVLENIYRHLEMGKGRRQASIDGRNEIGFTAVAITLVDVIVFFPISLTTGIVGSIFKQFALVVVFATLMSLFVSFTLTPMLASRFSRLEHFNDKSVGGFIFGNFERFLTHLNERYYTLIHWVLRPYNYKAFGRNLRFYWHAMAVFAISIVAFVNSFKLISEGYIGSAFFSRGDQGEFIVQVELPKDATLHETNMIMQNTERYLYKKKEVRKLFTTVGVTSGVLGGQENANVGEINVKLVTKEERDLTTDIYAAKVKNELEALMPGIKVKSAPVSFFGGADEDPIQVLISGNNLTDVMEYGKKALSEISKIKGTLSPELSVTEGNPEIKVNVNRTRMSEFGLDMATIGGTMQTAFSGNSDAKFSIGSDEYDINIKFDAFNRSKVEDISNISFMNNRGELIKLSQFADISQTTGPSQLERRDRQSAVTLKSKVLGVSEGTVGEMVRAKLTASPPPPGVVIKYDGNMKNQEQGFGSLGVALMASIIFIYLLLVALYDSWVYPLIVYFSLLTAPAGAFLAMGLTMSTLDIFSIIGIIMLMGLVAKNAILLIDFTNQLKEQGKSTIDALSEAGKERLRPILMTTIAMMIGMLPIALARGAGAEWKNGLAWALIGGLGSSMILTLVVVPAIYLFIDSTKTSVTNIYYRIFGKEEEDAADVMYTAEK
jgi:hydrophobic/amphiphilic exporter-1 (mainly G- bacteria), HAE1 family